MEQEYELRWYDVDIGKVRRQLKKAGATIEHKRKLIGRYVFRNPNGNGYKEIVRLRDEPAGPLLSLKRVFSDRSKNMEEMQVYVDDYETMYKILSKIYNSAGDYQEAYRETWKLKKCTITIDEWPCLRPLVEFESNNMDNILRVATAVGFNKNDALTGSVAHIYESIGLDLSKIGRLAFDNEAELIRKYVKSR